MGSLPIFTLFYSLLPIACVLLVLNSISWCFILQLSEHLINFIVLFFQLTSELYLTNQLWSKNMSVLLKSITTASSCFLCLLISISRSTTLVTSLFFISSILKILNEKFISLVCICFSLTSCSSISVCVHPESTSVLILRFLPFFVFTFTHTFNSLSILLCQFGIIYLLWDFTGEISHTVPTWDLLQILFHALLFIICFLLDLLLLHWLSFFAILGNVCFLITFKASSHFFLFLLPTFLGHMAIFVAIKVLQLSIFEVVIVLSNIHGLSSPTICHSYSCFIVLSSFCEFIFLSNWYNHYFPLLE